MESPPISESVGSVAPLSPVPELIGDFFVWKIGPDTSPSSEPITMKIAEGEEEVYVAESDCVPDKVCDLIAEYITDTICRIDSEAMVDIRVTMKADLIIATGEVACSHPAKSAIIHSDQFLSTLNSSIRDVLAEILARNSPQAPTAVGVPADTIPEASPLPRNQSSSAATPAPSTIPPLSPQGSMTALGGFDEIDTSVSGDIDLTNCHVIIAISPGIYKSRRDVRSGSWTGRAGSLRFAGETMAIKVEKFFTVWLRKNGGALGVSNGIGGISVEVLSHRERVHSVAVSLNAPKLGSLVSQLVANDMDQLRSLIGDGTYFSIRNVNRTSATGVSSVKYGKDWNHPARLGSVLAKLEAIHLVENKYCDACEVELRFSDSCYPHNSLGIVGVKVVSFGTVRDDRTDDDLREIIWERCSKMTIDEIKLELKKLTNSVDFFMLDHGGSSAASTHLGVVNEKP